MSNSEWMILSRMDRGLYHADCPVLVHAGEICAKGYGADQFVRFRFLNISGSAITGMTITASGTDVFGKTLASVTYRYGCNKVKPGACFGQEELIALPSGGFHRFTVSVDSVTYADGASWEKPDGLTMTELPRPQSLPYMGDLLDQYRLDRNCSRMAWRPQRHEKLWMCGCGAWNREDAPACCDCGCTLASQDPLPSDDELRAHLAQRRELEKQEAEQQRLLEEEAKARQREKERILAQKEREEFEAFERQENRKALGKRLLTLLILLVVATAACWPHIRVPLANALARGGNTELAAKIITFLPGFDYKSAHTEEPYFRILHDCAMARAAGGDHEGAEEIYRIMRDQNAFPAAEEHSNAGVSGLSGLTALEAGDYARAVLLLEASEGSGAVNPLKSEALSRAYLGAGDYYNAYLRMQEYAGDKLEETAAAHPGTAFMHQVFAGDDAATIRLSSMPTDPALPFVWDIHPQENGTARLQLHAADADSIDPLDFSAMEVVSFDRTSTAVYANLNTLANLTMTFAEAEQLMAGGDWAAAEQLLTQKGAPFWWRTYAVYAHDHLEDAGSADPAEVYSVLKLLAGEGYGDAANRVSNAGVRYARALTESGEYDAAVTVITESISDPAAAFDLAMALYQRNQFVHTITVMRTIADHPGASECINNCSELLTNEALDKGDYPTARIHAAGLTPDQLQVVAEQLLTKGNTAEALWYYQQADRDGSCTEQIRDCSRQLAGACLLQDDTEGAALLLSALTDADLLQLTEECIAAEKHSMAQWCASRLSGPAARADAAASLTACAEQLLAADRFAEAYALLSSLPTGSSSPLIAKTPALALLDRLVSVDYPAVALGLYEQDGNEENGGEPVRWLPVKLENGVLTLLSSEILAYGVYSLDPNTTDWEASLTHNWTQTFPDEVFEGVEAALLTDAAGDPVTLLTWEEALACFPDAANAAGQPTASAEEHQSLYGSRWWTRSSANGNRILVMPHNGNSAPGYLQLAAPTETCGLRPALRVSADRLLALLLKQENAMQLLADGRIDEAADILAEAGASCYPARSYALARQHEATLDELTAAYAAAPGADTETAVTDAYAELEAAFLRAGNTLDATDRLQEYRYRMGLWHEGLDHTEEAMTAFAGCGDYRDARSRLEQLSVRQAEALLEAHAYTEAIALLRGLEGNEAAAQLLAAPHVKRIAELIDNFEAKTSVYLGTFEQDGDIGTGTEPIEWIAIGDTDGSVKLISRYILDFQPWNDAVNTTARWSSCSLRAYLNGEFLQTSFTEAERALLMSQTVSTPALAAWGTAFVVQEACTDTVSLLSVNDACNLYSDVDASTAEATAYASSRYPYSDDTNLGNWWTRDLNSNKSDVATMPFTKVLPNRALSSYRMNNKMGVRPVITVSQDHLIRQQMQLEDGIALMETGNYAGALDQFASIGPTADDARQFSAAMLLLSQLEDGTQPATDANLTRVVDAMSLAGSYRDDTQLYRIACDLARFEMRRGNFMQARDYLSHAADSEEKAVLLSDKRLVFLERTLADLKDGKPLSFGHYNQDSTTANGNEPVEWLLVEDCGDHVTLVSRYILTYREWHSKNVSSVRWSSSTLSQWLNGTFLSSCFSSSEQTALVNKKWENATPVNWNWVLDQGSVTQRVTLMSLNEALTLYGTVEESKGAYTSRAYSDYIYNDKTYINHWWLRSMADEDFDAVLMPFAKRSKTSGSSSVSHGNMTNKFGVRPMIALDLNKYVTLYGDK